GDAVVLTDRSAVARAADTRWRPHRAMPASHPESHDVRTVRGATHAAREPARHGTAEPAAPRRSRDLRDLAGLSATRPRPSRRALDRGRPRDRSSAAGGL